MSNLLLIPPDGVGAVPKKKVVRALNGPCEGASIDAPYDAAPGNACALPWKGLKGTRYAVYLLVEHQGAQGLMYMHSYDRAEKAADKVRELSAICAAGASDA